MTEWVIGVDCHARSLMAVRVDELGRTRGDKQVRNTAAGLAALMDWAGARVGTRRWAIEGAGGYGLGLTREVQARGEIAVSIPGWLTSQERRRGGRRDKSDVQDARAAALALLRDTDLPLARAEDGATILQALADERDALVAERTQVINRMKATLGLLGGEIKAAVGALGSPAGARRALALQLSTPRPIQATRLAILQRQARRLLELHAEIAERTAELELQVKRIGTTLTDQPGCRALTAARLLAETGHPAHYRRGEASYARYSGTAPREASSGERIRHRLDRRGNRQLNAALHRIAVTQERMRVSPGRTYRDRRLAEGKTDREARRALKRHIANAVFRIIQRDIDSGRTNLALT